jgi:purine-binding chemotaxis protein CheW
MTELLTFDLEGNRFGVAVADVDQTVRAVMVAALPHAPPIVEGVINLRGRVVPVLDIRSRFRLRPKPLAPSDHMMIVRAGGRVVALRVDRVSDLVSVPDQDIVRAADVPSVGTLVAGVAKMSDGLVVIHDPSTFLTRAEAEALDSLDTGNAEA